jgi:putative DNA methylase
MRVRPALALINQVLDEVLSQQEGDFNADTRWCVEWFKSYGFEPGPYGVAETLSKAKNTAVAGLVRAGVLKAGAGKVRLMSVGDLPAAYDPRRDERVSEWEIAMHLAKRLGEDGAEAAGQLMDLAGEVADLDAVRELAYLLFSVAEKRGWADIALLFNGLGTSWSDLVEAARRQPASGAGVQDQLGFGEE